VKSCARSRKVSRRPLEETGFSTGSSCQSCAWPVFAVTYLLVVSVFTAVLASLWVVPPIPNHFSICGTDGEQLSAMHIFPV